ncbi:AraC family transcriptional regulator [Streptomyces sp. NRRL F-4489]|uniref:DNA-3-methyladenine glycosylase 2 family protein n=1 Tax=Streptomyces sp. NRRL F-4489 TaxID=1609095 RepID=UPI00074707ED|nr:DNA-3-methyladenine glycosylase 2 family protein [Streptomyces sp. NRRL F-4489]KUL49728.1 AraC family transcriptional regulator [Streptomyces sp. NRRL F-4489]
MLDFERCWRATLSRDTRFDGLFYSAVVTTGIYCRPSCPGCPKRKNVRFYRSAAAAQDAGYRACKRCNPDASPGSPEWNLRADVVGRAMRLIADGVCDREGVTGLAAQLGYTTRHLHRLLTAEVGVGPQALARAQRAQTARILLETTSLRITDVAMAAGFSSVRQFNDTMAAIFDRTPTALREMADSPAEHAAGTIVVRLSVREPFDSQALLRFFAAHAVPGIEEIDGATYRRSLQLPRGAGVVALTAHTGYVEAHFRLEDIRDLSTAIHRCRRLLDLDADPLAITELLAGEPVMAPLVAAHPGLRVPGAADPEELLLRTVLRQTLPGREGFAAAAALTRRLGRPLPSPIGAVTHLFPTAVALAEAPLAKMLPAEAAGLLHRVATELAAGDLTLNDGGDRAQTERQLMQAGLSGQGAAYLVMRALKDPDVFLAQAPATGRALHSLGQPTSLAPTMRRAEHWSPWRSYALMQLWNLHPGDFQLFAPAREAPSLPATLAA